MTARDSTLSERVAAAVVWAAMKVKIKIGMAMKLKKKTTTEEKDNEKADTSNGKTRKCVTFSANVGRARVLDW